MKLFVGLGNPGKKYEKTRHNMGYMVLDRFALKAQVDVDKEAFKGLFCRFTYEGEDILLLKPLTFMNLSGESVREIVSFFKIDLHDVYVVYDDLALEPGKIRLRTTGSSGGHNGMQNIIDLLKTKDLKRIRIGIGEPRFDPVDYVLGKPTKDEEPLIEQALDKAVEAMVTIIQHGFSKAMNTFN